MTEAAVEETGRELAVTESEGTESPVLSLLANPEALAKLPVEHMERVLAMQERWEANQARKAFFKAFREAQAELKPVVKRGKVLTKSGGILYHFATAEDLVNMLDPIIVRHGFSRSITSKPSPKENHTTFVLILRHEDGHQEEYPMEAPLAPQGGAQGNQKLQGVASAYTYCERHLLLKVWGVQTVKDDDGLAASGDAVGMEKVTEAQVEQMKAALEKVDRTPSGLCKRFGLDKIGDLPASRFQEAMTMIEATGKAKQ